MATLTLLFKGIDETKGVMDGFALSLNSITDLVGGAMLKAFELGSDAITSFVKDAMVAEQLTARLDAVIQSSGKDMGFTTEIVNTLADQFKDLAGGSDEAVKAIEEMALRMGTVSAKQMPDFIQTTLDLAAATGQDATNAARLLAQAYDDPASAMTRFNRMGIRFDAELQKQIKDLMKAGKTGEAYNLMLGRLGEATKGAASAMADTLSGRLGIMKEHLLDAGKAIGEALLPALETLFDTVIKPAIPVVEGLANTISNYLTKTISDLGENLDIFSLLGNLIMGLDANNPILQDIGNEIIALGDVVTKFAGYLTSGMSPFEILGNTIMDLGVDNQFLQDLGNIVISLEDVFNTTWPMIQAAIQIAIDNIKAKLAEFGPSIQNNVIGILDELITFWQKNGPTIIAIVTGTFNTIVNIIGPAMALYSGVILSTLQFVNGKWEESHQTMTSTLETFMASIVSLTGTNLEAVRASWEYVFRIAIAGYLLAFIAAVDVVTTFFNNGINGWLAAWQMFHTMLMQIVVNIVTGIQYAFTSVDWLGVGRAIMDGIGKGIKDRMNSVAGQAIEAAKGIINNIKRELGINSPSTVFEGIGQNMMSGLAQGIEGGAHNVMQSMSNISSSVSNTSNYNLTINTLNAPSIPAEFGRAQAWAGAL